MVKISLMTLDILGFFSFLSPSPLLQPHPPLFSSFSGGSEGILLLTLPPLCYGRAGAGAGRASQGLGLFLVGSPRNVPLSTSSCPLLSAAGAAVM